MVRMPSVRSTSSEGTGELGVSVTDQEAHRCLALIQLEAQVACLLGDEGCIRVAGRRGDVKASGCDLDEEQHVERPEERGLHRDEVTRQDALGLGT